jgi:predicted nucleic-acid-binding Zn-ribbon protein
LTAEGCHRTLSYSFVAPWPGLTPKKEGLVHVQEPTLRAVKCDACGTSLTLQFRPVTQAETAWRWFDCPKCRKPNFLRIAGHILQVTLADENI